LQRALRKLFRRSGRDVHAKADLSATLRLGGSLATVTGMSATTLEDKVEWLLRRDQEAQKQVSDLSKRLGELESAMPERLAALNESLNAHVTDKIAEAQSDFRATRILGALALTVGLGLTTAATLM
jgi:hypothetical protein